MFQSMYDCMAYLIRKILDNVYETYYENYVGITVERSRQINETLSQRFPQIIQNGNLMRLSGLSVLWKGVGDEICKFVDECCKQGDVCPLIRLLSKIDASLGPNISGYTLGNTGIDGLNNNVEVVKVQLLPRCKCSWAHKNKDKNCSKSLNNFLSYFYFIDVKRFYQETGCTVRHFFINALDFGQAAESGVLTLGISGLCDQIDLMPELSNSKGVYSFKIKSISDIDRLVYNAVHILRCAMQKQVNILCFPEMLGHPNVISALKSELQKFPDEKQGPNPVLTICPTYWNEHQNSAVILNNTGQTLFVQNKQEAYFFPVSGKKYIEDIWSDHCLYLIHCEGIGRIGIMICRDAINRNRLFSILNHLKVTLLFVPSFSTGYYDFEANLKQCFSFDCTAVWINSCSVRRMTKKDQMDTIGFCIKTGKASHITNGICYFKQEDCNKEIYGGCHKCLYTQQICFA